MFLYVFFQNSFMKFCPFFEHGLRDSHWILFVSCCQQCSAREDRPPVSGPAQYSLMLVVLSLTPSCFIATCDTVEENQIFLTTGGTVRTGGGIAAEECPGRDLQGCRPPPRDATLRPASICIYICCVMFVVNWCPPPARPSQPGRTGLRPFPGEKGSNRDSDR